MISIPLKARVAKSSVHVGVPGAAVGFRCALARKPMEQMAVPFDRRLLRRQFAMVQVDKGAGEYAHLAGSGTRARNRFRSVKRAPSPACWGRDLHRSTSVAMFCRRWRTSVGCASHRLNCRSTACKELELGDERATRDHAVPVTPRASVAVYLPLAITDFRTRASVRQVSTADARSVVGPVDALSVGAVLPLAHA